jgi:hypothetical protein
LCDFEIRIERSNSPATGCRLKWIGQSNC